MIQSSLYNITDDINDNVAVTDKIWSSYKIDATLNTKVDKVIGMGLSSNDFTDAYKIKLDGLSNYNILNDIDDSAVLSNKLWSSQKIAATIAANNYDITSDIDDANSYNDKVWSSSKIADELNKKIDNDSVVKLVGYQKVTGLKEMNNLMMSNGAGVDKVMTSNMVGRMGWKGIDEFVTLDKVLTAGNSANNKKITDLGDPVNENDAVNKKYIDKQYKTTNIPMSDIVVTDCSTSANFKINATKNIKLENPVNMEARTYTWFVKAVNRQVILNFGSNWHELIGSGDKKIPRGKVAVVVAVSDGTDLFYSISNEK